ncbi:MAG: hypothetical protein K0R90_1111, partial [Oscillospiraceae bacterium]|nr:hypothetical protein [Oscillospiraceae bacterium]
MKKSRQECWIKRIPALILTIAVLLSSLNLSVFAMVESGGTDSYQVTVKVAPSTVNASFYECAGFDSNGYDVLGSQITATDSGVVDSYHIYTFTASKGTYSFRGADGSGNNIGGMTFDVPVQLNVDGTGGGECEVVIRQCEIWTTAQINGAYATQNDYSVQVMDADGKKATVGSHYLNGNYTRFRFFLYAGGNAELYTYQLIPTQSVTDTYNLGVSTLSNQTVTVGTSVLTRSGTLPTLITASINAPDGADVSIFNQIRNFNQEKVLPISVIPNGNGTVKYSYKLPKSGSNYMYRVKKQGKITKAAYMMLTTDITYNVTFEENEDPRMRRQYNSASTTEKYFEDSMLLNINSRNYLRLTSGDTFKVRAYRAAWQIVNNVTGNIMIEPDFHYSIKSGDSVTLEQDSEKSQWAMLKAVKPGITVVEVTYDAIDVSGNGSFAGIYNANDPARKGLFVVNVDGDTSTDIDLNIGDWDSEMDTVYFTGDSSKFTFSPMSDAPITVKSAGVVYSPTDGAYTVDIKEGNNLIEVYAGNTVEYLLVRGNRVTPNIVNVTHPGEAIRQGDTVQLSFSGLHMPVPKFSGIYNPGFGNTMKVSYRANGGAFITSNGTQYDFINNHTLTFTVWDEGAYALTNGSIPMTMMCDPTNPWGQHRTLNDSGVGANFNASEVAGEFSILPDVKINVAKNEDPLFLNGAGSAYSAMTSVSILCGNSTSAKSFAFSNLKPTTASTKNNNTTFSAIDPSYPLVVTATPVNKNVTMEFRYWEEGDATKHTFPLKAGEALNLGSNLFSGNKMINMEIAVNPTDPIYGKGEVYSYIAYKAVAGFSRPTLKVFDVLSTESTSFGGNYGVLLSNNGKGVYYTCNNYTVYVPEDTAGVKLRLQRPIGLDTVQIGSTSLSVGYSSAAVSGTVNLTGDTTIIPMVVNESGSTRNYTLTVIRKSNLAMERMIADEILQNVLDSLIESGISNVAKDAITAKKNVAIQSIDQASTVEQVLEIRANTYNSFDATIELADSKAEAKNILDTYKDLNLYRNEQKAQLNSIIATAKSTIDTALDTAIVNNLLTQAKTDMDVIKTNAQLTAEEDAMELAELKVSAKSSLDSYKNTNDYRDAQKIELSTAIVNGKSAIDAASDSSEVRAAVENAKTIMDTIKTDVQLTVEETAQALAEAKAAAKAELDAYKDLSLYRDAHKTELNDIITDVKSAIDAVTDISEINPLIAQAKVDMDSIKTNAQLTEQESSEALAEA